MNIVVNMFTRESCLYSNKLESSSNGEMFLVGSKATYYEIPLSDSLFKKECEMIKNGTFIDDGLMTLHIIK